MSIAFPRESNTGSCNRRVPTYIVNPAVRSRENPVYNVVRPVSKTEILSEFAGAVYASPRLKLRIGARPGVLGGTASDQVTGLDIDNSRLAIAKVRFSNRTCLQAASKCLPFEDESFYRVISAVALPYMNIQKTLAEIQPHPRSCGCLSLSLHLPGFTIAELLHNAIPKPVPKLFRLYVLANGLFPCTGRTVGFLKGKDGIISD